MLLNLNLDLDDAGTSKSKPNVTQVTNNLKKGSWKKRRMDAKKIIQRVKKLSKPSQPDQSKSNDSKQQKPIAVHEEFRRKNKVAQKPEIQRPEIAKSGFSSSLFTANPTTPKQKKEKTVESIKAVVDVAKVEPEPIFNDTTFQGLGINAILSSHLQKLKISQPTPIQRSSIPKLNSITDRDMIIQAQTGSGKTFAFLLPILNQLLIAGAELETKYGKEFFTRITGPFAIILAPTRELALQISTVLETLLRYTRNASDDTNPSHYYRHWIVSGIITGGESKKSEKSRIRKGLNIIVATPGRLLDHLKTTESLAVGNVRWLVLDEADNLLHLGFEETLKEILQILNEKGKLAVQNGQRHRIPKWPFERQTVLCSATIEGGVKQLAENSLRDPIFVKSDNGEVKEGAIGSEENTNEEGAKDIIAVPKQLKQFYVMSPAKLRLVNLIGLIRKITESGTKPCKIIVFLATGDSVDWHFDSLHRISESPDRDDTNEETVLDPAEEAKPMVYNDLPKLRQGYESKVLPNCRLFRLHGSLMQSERHATFTGFSPALTSTTSILFCTDVAARGLDVPDVSHIIQYDPPADVRDYIHRIGRTARIGKEGEAYIFLLPSEIEYLDLLEDYHCSLKDQPTTEILQKLVPLATSNVSKKSKHLVHEIAATDVHMSFERFVQANQTNLIYAQKAFGSFIRAYTTHIASERHIFHIRKLHLGHLAKSFCLREAPALLQSKLGNLVKSQKDIKNSAGGGITAGSMKRKAVAMAQKAMISEFDDGNIIQGMKKQKK
ncbi:P-loop containing nucleoside triphosphate hydrolase protein [Globomyces pollinis-pini]|nr:P-loop containing nucleoside triphosphate hydrolase protein [Globomyces pollinis-pini]